MDHAGDGLSERFARDGYAFPLRVMSEEDAKSYRDQLEAIERTHAGDPDLMGSLRGYSNFILPFVDEIARRDSILDPVSQLLGPDLLVWGCSLFIKEAASPHYIGWHQDLTYWGLDNIEEVTAWLALSPAWPESGCMRFLPGSHRQEIVRHRDTFAEHSLLTRGQEVAVEVDEAEAVDVVLAPGEISLHHGHTFHGSHPNRSDDRRIGLAIRYITPSMRQTSGTRPLAVLVRGEDRYGHFELAPAPSGVMTPDGVARMRRARLLHEEVIYAGVDRAMADRAMVNRAGA